MHRACSSSPIPWGRLVPPWQLPTATRPMAGVPWCCCPQPPAPWALGSMGAVPQAGSSHASSEQNTAAVPGQLRHHPSVPPRGTKDRGQPRGSCAKHRVAAEAAGAPVAQHPASGDVPSWRATRGTWETRSRGQSGARAGGFPGFKIHAEERAQAAAQPHYACGRSRHSPKQGRGRSRQQLPTVHLGSPDTRCPRPWGDLRRAASAHLPSQNLSAGVTLGKQKPGWKQGRGRCAGRDLAS